MRRRDIVLVSLLLASVVVGMFIYTYMQKGSLSPIVPVVEAPTQVSIGNKYGLTRIEAKHFYRDGVHTIAGELSMPTPCDLLTYNSLVAESAPEQVTFAFDVINESEACATVVTTQRFIVNASANVDASLSATFMGESVELNLVEALPTETPESFELFIKG